MSERIAEQERTRCLGIVRHAEHMAKVGAMKFFTSVTPLEAAERMAGYIAETIESGVDYGQIEYEGDHGGSE